MTDKEFLQSDAISNSRLSLINPEQGGHPRKFKDKNYDEIEFRQALERGTAIHLALLEPDKFVKFEHERPADYIAKLVESIHASKEEWGETAIISHARAGEFYKNWRDETIINKVMQSGGKGYYDYLMEKDKSIEEGLICLDSKSWDVVQNCVNSVKSHGKAMELLTMENEFTKVYNYKELAIISEYPTPSEGGTIMIPLKGKLDNMVIDFTNKKIWVTDLKTTGKSIALFKESYERFRYYRQIAYYSLLSYMWLMETYPDEVKYEWEIIPHIIAVETSGEHRTGVFRILESEIERGTEEYLSLLKRIARHKALDEWDMTLEEIDGNGVMTIGSEIGD